MEQQLRRRNIHDGQPIPEGRPGLVVAQKPGDSQLHETPSRRRLDKTPDSQVPVGSNLTAKIERVRSQQSLQRLFRVSLNLKSTAPGLREEIQSHDLKRLPSLLPLGQHDRVFNHRSGAHHPLDRTDRRNDRFIQTKIMAGDFQ